MLNPLLLVNPHNPTSGRSEVRAGKYMITVFKMGSLGVECTSNDDCVIIFKIHPNSILQKKFVLVIFSTG